ncbi:hypothetical protein C9J12_01925 [Photobacterium frigidiphilum]|uniref:DUF2057 domain-containing protein n=1 Tax=Photobacterium frigidiphilum TaxID=264736 RepID=A0A2T3JRK3_9GAMM|nr:DUF2057 domain-containing protein [Photobacterium frigidiphilum]PSU51724.1 hypothetical protein C9J12_01925 [Photobacterium frigidiphilum]
MKLKTIAATGLLSLLALPAFADVTLHLPDQVTLLSVNGAEGKSGLLQFISKSSPESINLPNGNNQIVYEVSKIFNKGSTQGKRYQSSAIVLSFDSADSSLVMEVPPLNSMSAANKFDKSLAINLKDKSGSPLQFTNELLPINELSFKKNYSSLLSNYNQSKNPSTITTTHSTAASSQHAEPVTANFAAPVSDMTALKQSFNQMDSKSKQAFLSWAVQNIN